METWQPQPRRESRGTALRLVVATLVLGGAYGGLSYWASGHLPASVTVGGIQVGGMTPERAAAQVQRGAAEVLARPIELTVPGRTDPLLVVPSQAGLRVDVDRSLEGLTGFTLSPSRIWDKLTGSVQVPLLTSADDDLLESYVAALAPTVEQQPHQGGVAFTGGRVSVDPSVAGATLDVPGTKLALRRAFPDTAMAPAAVHVTPPDVAAADIQRFADTVGSTVVSGPVTLTAGSTRAVVGPSAFAPFVSAEPDGNGGLRLVFDEPGLARLVASRVRVPTKVATNARWVLGTGAAPPALVPSVDGTAVDEDAVAKRFSAAITGPDRTVDVRAVAAEPAFTTADAQRAGVTTAVARFDAAFPQSDAALTGRLVAAAQKLNGLYVPAGGSLSLRSALGEGALTSGETWDPESAVVVDGRVLHGTGGGIAPIPTVVYNLGYLAGVPVSATPHASYRSRYPEGRDAAVYWPSVDTSWRNDSPYGMLLQTWVAGGVVHGRLWSTRVWDVRSVAGPRTNVVEPGTVSRGDLSCIPQQPVPGFEVTVTRQWYRPGSPDLVRSEDVTARYVAQDRVVCTNPFVTPP
jgi:vancomycin resistance protein YoaR